MRVHDAIRKAVLAVPPVRRLQLERSRWHHEADRWRAKAAARAESNARLRRKLAEAQADARAGGDAAAWGEVREAFPPGHFYSPIPDLTDVRRRESAIFDRSMTTVPGVDLRYAQQLAMLPEFEAYYREQPFGGAAGGGLRYGFHNDFFGSGDGLALYCMLRRTRPRRLIEIGSGWSSALILDVNERFLSSSIDCTFIEPFPERLNSLLTPADREQVRVIERPLSDVPLAELVDLRAGDMLFIDSTHVSRVGSDVNLLFLDVIPRLPPGVIVHVHDIFWPFEYAESWVYEGRAWNESYLLRALLVNNPALEILWFNDYLACHHRAAVRAAMPLWDELPGASLYLATR